MPFEDYDDFFSRTWGPSRTFELQQLRRTSDCLKFQFYCEAIAEQIWRWRIGIYEFTTVRPAFTTYECCRTVIESFRIHYKTVCLLKIIGIYRLRNDQIRQCDIILQLTKADPRKLCESRDVSAIRKLFRKILSSHAINCHQMLVFISEHSKMPLCMMTTNDTRWKVDSHFQFHVGMNHLRQLTPSNIGPTR